MYCVINQKSRMNIISCADVQFTVIFVENCISTTIDLYPEFEDMDDLEKFVFLNSNLQKHVIVFITSAVLRRRTLLFH